MASVSGGQLPANGPGRLRESPAFADSASMFYQIEVPGLRGFVDLPLEIHALVEGGRRARPDQRAGKVEEPGSGASARAVTTSTGARPRRRGSPRSGPGGRPPAPPVSRAAVRRKAHFRALLSTRWTVRSPPRSARRIATTSPGKPAAAAEVEPVPRRRERAGRAGRCRRHGASRSRAGCSGATRFSAFCHFATRATNAGQPVICFT